ncbi:hypothetical protein RZS08_45705, partial [Arthrospira platensis SPKY1]|nr:hypothetical protein [Arthrospira platensis SPKY1]
MDYNWVDNKGARHFGTMQGQGVASVNQERTDTVSIEIFFPRTEAGIPCDVTIRYTIVEGVPGLFVEAKLHHPADAPSFELEQLRLCYVVEPSVGSYGRTPVRHLR